MFERYKFESYPIGIDRFVVEVSNVVDVVLDENMFEHLRLSLTFVGDESELHVNYTLDCKYASGIIWAPRSNGYYDMLTKYSEQMVKYNQKLQGKISTILTGG